RRPPYSPRFPYTTLFRSLTLTDAGKEYLVSCKRALRLLREGRELLDKHRASPSGLLRVACPITMARDLIAPLLSKFMEAFPDLRDRKSTRLNSSHVAISY